MELSGFFGSINGDRRYRSVRWARYFAKFVGNGVYAREANQLQVVAGEGMQIIVRPGAAYINGYDYENTTDKVINLENADGVLNRIVRVVIQWNLIERKISAEVRYSPFATNPTAPALQRNPDIFELGRADVFIGRGVTRITQSAITDHLLNNSLCGIVRLLDGPLNTDHLDAQLKAWFEEFTEESLREFLDWFNLLKDVLGEDAAGEIMNHIRTELNLIYYIIAPNNLTTLQRAEIESNDDLMGIVEQSRLLQEMIRTTNHINAANPHSGSQERLVAHSDGVGGFRTMNAASGAAWVVPGSGGTWVCWGLRTSVATGALTTSHLSSGASGSTIVAGQAGTAVTGFAIRTV